MFKPLYMSNLKRHFRKRNRNMNLPLGATIQRNITIHITQRFKGIEYCLCTCVSLSLTLETLDLWIRSGWVTAFWKSWCRSVFPLKLVSIIFPWLLPNRELVKTPDTQRDSSLFHSLPHADLSIPLFSASSSFPPCSFCLFSTSGDSSFLASFLNRLVKKEIWWEMCFVFLMGLMVSFRCFCLHLNISSLAVAGNLLSLAEYPLVSDVCSKCQSILLPQGVRRPLPLAKMSFAKNAAGFPLQRKHYMTE